MAIGRSIHIGLNHVDPSAYNGWDGALSGCINDANGMKAVADSVGYSSMILTDSQATSIRVIQEIADAAQLLQAGDTFLVTYSGHGGQVHDANSEEEDAMDETWVLWDREVIDDELASLWSQFQAGVRIIVCSDSCHSGTVLKQKMTEDVKLARTHRRSKETVSLRDDSTGNKLARTQSVMTKITEPSSSPETSNARVEDIPKSMPWNIQEAVNKRDRAMYDTLQWITGPARDANIQASVLLISGCQDNQLSYDGTFNGQFTGTLLQVWNNGNFQGNYKSFHQEILNRMPPEQSPNYYRAGSQNLAFEQERPFTIRTSTSTTPTTTPTTTTTTTPTTTRPILRYGSSGSDVRYLQEKLNQLGFSLVVNGKFGIGTEGAVKEFQFDHSLTTDGIVVPSTWQALEQAI